MCILKIQIKNRHEAVKCAAYLSKSCVVCVRFGSAVVLLSTSRNNAIVSNAITTCQGYTISPSNSDKARILSLT